MKAEFKHSGWLVIISNHVSEKVEALRIYRTKDVVEKGFMRLKNSLDLGRLRVHGDNAIQNKLFVGFLALVIMSSIHNVMSDKDLYKKYTMKKPMYTLSKHRIHKIGDRCISNSPTKEQSEKYKALEFSEILL